MKNHKEGKPTEAKEGKRVSWSGVQRKWMGFQKCIYLHKLHRTSYNMVDLSGDLDLGTGASFLSVKSRKLQTNIKKSDNPITMCTNVVEQPILETG